MSNGASNVDRSGHCARPDELKRVLTAEILQTEHEVATGLVRTAVEEGRIGRAERIDVELLQQIAKANPQADMATLIPTAPWLSCTAIAIPARSNRGSAIPGMARSSLLERNRG
jgi:hypothetical protein